MNRADSVESDAKIFGTSGEWPKRGESFTDYSGRTLVVEEIHRGDKLGREIQGKVDGEDYATDQKTWFAIWKERRPPAKFRH
jgi:hypothetical protein